MIYMVTGVPGSGKTLYAVSTLIKKLMGETIEGKGGEKIKRRLLVDGIPDLIIDHELMAPRPDVDLETLKGKAVEAVTEDTGQGLHNWWTWAKPGDVLVIDEVQRYWRPRGMGSKVPKEVSMLETHRHFGIDIIVITQNAMLLDQNVRRLVGRHLNVRRIFGGARALIYDWDGCQTDVHRTAGAVRTMWSYPKDAYKLYKSSELHTKQHQKIPLWFAFPLVVLALAIFTGPKAYSALSGAMTGKGIQSAAAPASAAKSAAVAASGVVLPSPGSIPAPVVSSGAVVPVVPGSPVGQASAPRLAGCASMRGVCRCYDVDAKAVTVDPKMCIESAVSVAVAVAKVDLSLIESPDTSGRVKDLQLIDDIRRIRDRQDGTIRRTIY